MHRTHTFVLVHDFWQGAWSWEQTAAILAARGHRVFCPALPGHDAAETERSEISHNDYADSLLRTVAEAGPDRAVLVGHGFSGAVISQVADRWPDCVARLVYYAACVLLDGEAIGNLLALNLEAALRELSLASKDRSLSMPWELWRSDFMVRADDEAAQAVYNRLVPQPHRPVFEPAWLPRLAGRGVPAAYVAGRQDHAQPAGFWHPGMTNRLPGAPVIEIDADHQALFTAPELLADALCAAAG